LLAKLVGGGFNELYYPLDLWVPEANIFLSLYHNPLYIASWTLILAIFLLMLLAWENNDYRYSWGAGGLALVLFNIHPYHPPTIYGILGIYLVVLFILEKKFWFYAKHYLYLIIISLPSIFYNFWLLWTNPVVLGRTMESVNLITHPLATISGYGFLFLFAVFGLIIFLKNKGWQDKKLLFIVIWTISSFVLIHFNFLRFPRRLTEGLQFPLVVLSIYFLFYLYNLLKNKINSQVFNLIIYNKGVLIFPFIILFTFSNIYIYLNDLIIYYHQYPNYYISNDFIKVTKKIKEETSEDILILASYKNSNLIPGLTGRRIYAGHFGETINHLKKIDEINWFYSTNDEDELKYQFLRSRGVNFVFYGPEEKALGNFPPQEKNYLKKVYQSGDYSLYQVL